MNTSADAPQPAFSTLITAVVAMGGIAAVMVTVAVWVLRPTRPAQNKKLWRASRIWRIA